MENPESINLKILEEIERGGSFTQRDLSERLSIALGLSNAYLRRLVEKGYVMVTTMPRKRIFYNLTPVGILEKSRLTLLYMRDSANYYRELRAVIRRTLASLRDAGRTRVVLFGTGEIAEIVYLHLREMKLELVAVVDTGRNRQHFFDLEVFGAERLAHEDFHAVIVAEDAGGDLNELANLVAVHGLPIDKTLLFTGQGLRTVQTVELTEPPAADPTGDA